MPYSSQLLSSCTEALMTLLRHCFSAPDEKKRNLLVMESKSEGTQEIN